MATPTSPQPTDNEYTTSHAPKGKFRFKSSSSTKSKSHIKSDDHHHPSSSSSHRHRHRHHRHKDSHKHKRTTEDGQPTSPSTDERKRRKTTKSNLEPEDGPPPLSPNTAFRESLFDALGDDEGAAYWESVYGQPIHTYAVPSAPSGPSGELEAMTEEEYAAYVRSKMWERTREGMIEEQERIRAEKNRRQRNRERETEERMRFEQAMEESLARGRERKRGKMWKKVWEEYLGSWEEVDRAVLNATIPTTTTATADAAPVSCGDSNDGKTKEKTKLRNLLFWPVESGKRRDISREAVEEFMRRAPLPSSTTTATTTGGGEAQEKETSSKDDLDPLVATLKTERVRWHPDKIQHRYGVLGIDEPVMRSVTEVFQIIDDLWNEVKKK